MAHRLGGLLATTTLLCAAPALGAPHPAGVARPLRAAAIQPSGLAHALPSTRRYVLVWKDQLADAVQGITAAQKPWIAEHYVGTQKLFQSQIDEYRAYNPEFLLLVYHLAYGLNGADQANPVGNITGPQRYGQEDTDTFTPWIASSGAARESAYQHTASPGSAGNRVTYPDPYWLMDLEASEWRDYLGSTLVTWCGYPTTGADGVFLDVAFFPWYGYQPDTWWSGPAGGGSRASLRDWWNPRAKAYFDALRASLAPSAEHPRYLVIPNPDALVDGTDEPEFLEGTDGAFTENWQVMTASSGDWNLSARRIARYVTSAGKVWMSDITVAGTTLSQADREMLIGTYLLIRNGTSYIMFGGDDVTWYPEYELDLGAYDAEPPADLEDLRVAGSGGPQGGLYARSHVAGLVLVNSSTSALSYTLPKAMKRARWSGGGAVGADASEPARSLTYTEDVPAGSLSVPAFSVVVLQDPTALPAPGDEPGGPGTGGAGGSGGATSSGGAGGATSSGGAGGATSSGGAAGSAGASAGMAGDGTSSSGDDGGCGCRAAPRRAGTLGAWGALLLALGLRRRASAARG